MTEAASPSLLDRLRAADLDAARSEYGRNRRIVLSRRDEIEAALAAGYSLLRVFTQLRDEGSLTTEYSSFRRAVRSAGLGGKRPAPASPEKTPPAQASTYTPPGKPGFVFERPTGGAREFVHNPRPDRRSILWGDDPPPETTEPTS